MAMPERFLIRFTGVNRAMAVLGIVPAQSRVEVDDGEVRVRMGWAFRLDAPRPWVRSASPDNDPVRGWGVHGWHGRWLVNGSSQGLVRLDFDPPVRAHTAGFAVRLDVLRVSVEDPEGLVAALQVPAPS